MSSDESSLLHLMHLHKDKEKRGCGRAVYLCVRRTCDLLLVGVLKYAMWLWEWKAIGWKVFEYISAAELHHNDDHCTRDRLSKEAAELSFLFWLSSGLFCRFVMCWLQNKQIWSSRSFLSVRFLSLFVSLRGLCSPSFSLRYRDEIILI